MCPDCCRGWETCLSDQRSCSLPGMLSCTGVRRSTRCVQTRCLPAVEGFHVYCWVQALSDKGGQASMSKGGKVLEINPRHPLIQELRTRVSLHLWSLKPPPPPPPPPPAPSLPKWQLARSLKLMYNCGPPTPAILGSYLCMDRQIYSDTWCAQAFFSWHIA